jgi:hypothetical protein
MSREWCNPENYGGGEAHYANRHEFGWIVVDDNALWFCESCRWEISKLEEVTNGKR